jgi:quinone-modifying oxidoreductase subunit QmoB
MDKIGVYLCSGCGIGDVVDLAKAAKVATGEYKVPVCKTHAALCGDEGTAMIRADIQAAGLDAVVVAACSARAMSDAFQFGGTHVERANFREHLAWCHAAGDEDTDMLAEDYMRMAVVRAQKTEPLTPFALPEGTFCKDVLVVGGGLVGLTAALAAAKAGSAVRLVEKEAALGGWMAAQYKEIPEAPPYKDLEDVKIGALIERVTAEKNITLHLGNTIAKTDGAPGYYTVTLSGGETFTTGAIVLATGATAYDVAKVAATGYGTSPNIITRDQLEAMAKAGAIVQPSTGKKPEPMRVVFVQCAGSRDKDHLAYCSAECCRITLKQARYVKEQYPAAEIYVLYKDLRAFGQHENFYTAVLDDGGVTFTKADVKSVTADGDTLTVVADDVLVGDELTIEADLVVLANGMVPSTVDTKANPVLNLGYRLGTDLPDTRYGFPDSEFICFPYETRRTAIYAAGAVRQPMDPLMAADDAYGAALKAIQAMDLISQGMAVHPRALDLSYPDFGLMRCTQCKRCTEECPFGALDEDVKGTPMPNPTRCRRCGICMGACPERIVSFKNYNVNMVSAMIKAIEIPEEDEEKPRVLCLICENDAYPALDLAGMNKMTYSAFVRFVPVRCLGSVNVIWINDSLASGFDGILLIGCKHGDDYQCHFVKGSELAGKRMENVSEKLKQLALEPERVQIHEVALTDYARIPEIIDGFMATIDKIGMNPFKGM